MISTLDQFYNEAAESAALLNAFAKKHDLANIARADHICYKCSSSNVFETMRMMFEFRSAYIYQSIISKRRIAYIKIPRSLSTSLGDINFLELSDQKLDGSQTDRFDHIELYPIGISYEELVQKIVRGGEVAEKVERPHHTTHDVKLDTGFLVRFEPDALVDKIKREEMI